jgi:hypothetical protein
MWRLLVLPLALAVEVSHAEWDEAWPKDLVVFQAISCHENLE